LRQPVVERSPHAVEQPAGVLGHVPLVDRDHQRATFLEHHRGDLEILMLQPARRIEQQHDHFGKSIARRASATDSRSSLSTTCAFLRIPAVSIRRMGRFSPWPDRATQSTAMESRVIPASGPVSRRSSPRRLISVDFPAFGRPTIASFRTDRDRIPVRPRSVLLPLRVHRSGKQGLEQIREPFAVLSGKGDRIAETKRVGSNRPASPARPSALLASSTTEPRIGGDGGRSLHRAASGLRGRR
jgi:hypothetical protein